MYRITQRSEAPVHFWTFTDKQSNISNCNKACQKSIKTNFNFGQHRKFLYDLSLER